MKISQIIQYNPEKKTTLPVFYGKTNPKFVSETTEEICKELSKAIKSDSLTQKIKSQISNPEQKNVFFAAIASLITATAAQLTEILTGNSENELPDNDSMSVKKTQNIDGDSFETEQNPEAAKNIKFQFSKHKGHQADYEIELADTLEQISNNLSVQDEENTQLTALYNKFCGMNYKGQHYSADNELLTNQEIAKNLIKELKLCRDSDNLNNIISKYNLYSLESNAEPVKMDAEVLKIIKDYPHITDSYTLIAKEKDNTEKQTTIEDFIKDLNQNPIPKSVKQIQLKNINSFYNENLYELASIYNEIKTKAPDLSEKFMSLISNHKISADALQKWEGSAYKYYLSFFEYNSMIYAGLNDSTIKEIAQQKRNFKLNNINVKDSEKFVINPPFSYIHKNFFVINSIFKSMHNNETYTQLSFNEPDLYTLSDLEAEVTKHIDSYPNLKKHLSVKDKDYLNQGKMQNLLNLYYGNKINKNLFTIHSYLRFIERVVIPEINEHSNMEEANYCKTINKVYIAKAIELKQALQDNFKQPVEFQTYIIGDVKAPQFTIPMANPNGSNLTITINRENKIHTIF